MQWAEMKVLEKEMDTLIMNISLEKFGFEDKRNEGSKWCVSFILFG